MATKNESKIEKQAMSPEVEAAAAMIAKMIEEAKAEAKAILDGAREQAKEIASGKPTMSEEEQKLDAYWNEDVEIQLFKDANRYKDDVYVAVNGENCLIQRGKPVKVKRKFAEALKRSMEQDNETADMIRELTSDCESKADKLN